jgi:PKD repeat protein
MNKLITVICIIIVAILVSGGALVYLFWWPSEEAKKPPTEEGANTAPIAVIQASATHVRELENITFDGGNSTDPDENDFITYYEWDFGDGTSRVGAEVSRVEHNYTDAGEYIVTLTVVDSHGVRDEDNVTITVVPLDFIDSMSVLLYAPDFELIPARTNATYSFEIEEGAINCSLTFGASGAGRDGSGDIEIEVLDPHGALVTNLTESIIGSINKTIFIEEPQLQVIGTYTVEILCTDGVVYITVRVEVHY